MNKQNLIVGILVVVVLILAGFNVYLLQKQSVKTTETTPTTPTTSPVATTTPTATPTVTVTATPKPEVKTVTEGYKKLSYLDRYHNFSFTSPELNNRISGEENHSLVVELLGDYRTYAEPSPQKLVGEWQQSILDISIRPFDQKTWDLEVKGLKAIEINGNKGFYGCRKRGADEYKTKNCTAMCGIFFKTSANEYHLNTCDYAPNVKLLKQVFGSFEAVK